MDSNLTINSIAFNKVSDGDFASIRQNVGLGVDLPRQMLVGHVNESGRSAGTVRSKVEFKYRSKDAITGLYYDTSAAVLVRAAPQSTTAQIQAVIAALVLMISEDSPDYASGFFLNREI